MRNRNILTFGLLSASLFISGCQEYFVRHDGVTTHAGNQLAANEAKMVVDPWNRDAYNNHIEGDGQRLGDAVKRYKESNSEKAGNDQQTILLPTAPSSETN